MSLIMMTTTTAQSVLANGAIPLTTIARRKCQAVQGINNTVVISKPGYYKVSGTITFTAPVAGNISVELLKNGTAVPGINSAATISTADTQIKTIAIDGIVRVYCNETAILTLLNAGLAIDTSNVELSVIEV